MDLLFRRYASPFSLLNSMIDYRSLSEFVTTLWNEYNDELLWDMYLHTTMEESFDDFRHRAVQHENEEDSKTTIAESKNILNGFKPS